MKGETAVQRYYELNTRRFLRFGQGHNASAIHRAIRHPDAIEPFRYQELLILNLMNRMKAEVVVDLGCGVGSSLLWLSEHYPARYLGITLSPLQARMANRLFQGKPISVRSGSYLNPSSFDDVANETKPVMFFGIESWLHCADPAELFRILGERTKPGDVLALWDDFQSIKPDDSHTLKLLEDFRKGWHALNVLTPEETDKIAETAGFKLMESRDLTSFLEIDRIRDRFIGIIVPILKPLKLKSAWWQNLLGGNALRTLLKSGKLNYSFRVWIKL